ncbi:MAG TPA: hypothetical protein VFM73_01910 [Xanthomonadaceae bacterium]|nr:hypothetical protein [Xanthomonadaceae bacterium]
MASRRALGWIFAGALLLLLVVAVVLLLQADRVARFALGQAGDALGLEITATGAAEYRIRDTPTLVVRDVVARAPGAPVPVLTADRVLLSMPWSTLRGRLRELDFTRIELDAPVLQLDALQDWLATRPPGDGRVPTLREGIVVDDGTIVADGWRIEAVDLALPSLHADRPVHAHATGQYVTGGTRIPFDLYGVLERPSPGHAIGVAGTATLVRQDLRMPARLRMGGTWESDDAGWGIARMTLGMTATYASDDQSMRFALGLFGPLRHADGRTSLAPVHVALRPMASPGDSPIPPLDAAGSLVVADGLDLRLAGTMHRWPASWPALPAPLDDTAAPTGFELRYAGGFALDDVASLSLSRGAANADARLRLPDITAWVDGASRGTPLPPLDATASVPRLEIAGATLHGVELVLDDPSIGSDDTGPAGSDD